MTTWVALVAVAVRTDGPPVPTVLGAGGQRDGGGSGGGDRDGRRRGRAGTGSGGGCRVGGGGGRRYGLRAAGSGERVAASVRAGDDDLGRVGRAGGEDGRAAGCDRGRVCRQRHSGGGNRHGNGSGRGSGGGGAGSRRRVGGRGGRGYRDRAACRGDRVAGTIGAFDHNAIGVGSGDCQDRGRAGGDRGRIGGEGDGGSRG